DISMLAVADEVETDEDTPVDIDVLANDVGLTHPPFTVAISRAPNDGDAEVLQTNHVSYTGAQDFNGEDTFMYSITDGNEVTVTATVTVTVHPVNDAPVADTDTATTAFNVAIDIDVRANDVDVDHDPLTVTAVVNPQHGTATITGAGNVRYTPDVDFHGVDSFS